MRNPLCRKTTTIPAIIAMVIGILGLTRSQETATHPPFPYQREVPDAKSKLIIPQSYETSPAYRYSSDIFFAIQVNVDDSSQNIIGDAANEPSIAVDPQDPNRMAIGWRQFDTISSSFRQAGYAFSTDGGQSWKFPGVIEPGVFRSDPVLDSDSAGNFYYNSLTVISGDYQCDVFKSSNGGATWDNGTFAQGGDKQWMVIDKSGSIGEGHIYAYWTWIYSICAPGVFTWSTNRGLSYDSCVTFPQNPYWGTLAVGPDGELYVIGASTSGGFIVVKSTTARDSATTVTWDTTIALDLDGEIYAFAGSVSPNPNGLLGQAWIAVDHSNGPYRGNVYALCSVNRNSVSDSLDVMFARSTDGGLTWSSPLRVNDDSLAGAWQWFGTMSVAPNGRIDVIWLDTRDNPGSVHSSLYYSYSTDGGESWTPNQRLSDAFDPHLGWPQQNKMGDYFDMISEENGAHLAWAGTFNGEQDVYYGRITLPPMAVETEDLISPGDFLLSQNYPNPFNPTTIIRWELAVGSHVELTIYDLLGQKVRTLVDGRQPAGAHQVEWDGRDDVGNEVASGVYIYKVKAGEFVRSRKMALIR